MSRRDLIWIASYAAAFADAMHRGCHGQHRYDVSLSEEPIDATEHAHAWATMVADLAAERSAAK